MLILSRKAGQSIVVGGNVSISVLGVRGGAVRLGVEAPRDVPVYRQELLMRPDCRIPAADADGTVSCPATANASLSGPPPS